MFRAPEAVIGVVLFKKVFLKILQISQENACVGVWRPATLLKKDSNTSLILKFAKFLRASIVKNICEQLLLEFLFFSYKNFTFKIEALHSGVWKKINSCFLEFLNYWFYATDKKEVFTPKFSTKKLFEKFHAWKSPFLVKKF